MDVIFTDAEKVEQGAITAYGLDIAYGEDENDFVLTVAPDFELEEGAYIYVDDTQWGGIVRRWKYSRLDGVPVREYRGDTWHGMMARSIVCPNAGEDYYRLSGDANACLSALVAHQGMNSVFSVSKALTKAISYQFNRYCNMYQGVCRMLAENGLKLSVSKQPGEKPELSAVPVGEYIDDGTLYGIGYSMEDGKAINHLICLGKGDLKDRDVIHLYADELGNVSQTQTFFGTDEITDKYDASNVEHDELLADGTKKLKEYQLTANAQLQLPEDMAFDIGDHVGVVDEDTGLSVDAYINKVIVKVDSSGTVTVENETGEISAGKFESSQGGSASGLDQYATKAQLADYALKRDYLPLAGGTMQGDITKPDGSKVGKTNGRVTSIEFDKNESQYGTTRTDLVTVSCTDARKPADGFVESYFWDNSGKWDAQFYVPNNTASGPIMWRGRDGDTAWKDWISLIDSRGGTINGDLTVTGNMKGTLNTVGIGGSSDNSHGYRVIGQTTLRAWHNCRVLLTISSRHSGNGLVALDYGCNAATVSAANIYCYIRYFGVNYDYAYGIKAYLSGSTVTFIWEYGDYNSTNIQWLNVTEGFEPINGTWTTNPSSYGSLIATMQTKIEEATGGSTVQARDNSVVVGTSHGQNANSSLNCVASQLTTNGAWSIGNLSGTETLAFVYTTNANYNANNNDGIYVYLPNAGGTIITSASIGSQSVNYASTSGKSSKVGDSGDNRDTTFAYSKPTLNYSDITYMTGWYGGAELRAVAKSSFMGCSYANSYDGLYGPNSGASDWIRTTSNGLIPYASGGNSSQLGTSSWPFKTSYINGLAKSSTTYIENNGQGTYIRCISDWIRSQNQHYFNSTLKIAGTSIQTGSSIKIKKDVESITSEEAERLMHVRPVTFNFKEFGNLDTSKRHAGVIAEELEQVFPEFVDAGKEGSDELSEVKSVRYTELIPHIIKLCQDQQRRIEELEKQVADLTAILS